jgi:hypothetical protein
LIEDYFLEIAAIIKAEASIAGSSIAYDKRTPHIGFIRGSLYFADGSVLHVRGVFRGFDLFALCGIVWAIEQAQSM